MAQFMSTDSYSATGMQESFLKKDELSNNLFSLLLKLDPAMAKGFFEERQSAEAKFDLALKQV